MVYYGLPEKRLFYYLRNPTLSNDCVYRIAKIYYHINQCNASVQYFAVLQKNKRRSMMRHSFRQKL